MGKRRSTNKFKGAHVRFRDDQMILLERVARDLDLSKAAVIRFVMDEALPRLDPLAKEASSDA